MKPTRGACRALAALLAPLAVLLLAAAPVGAHGGDGEIEIVSVEREGADVTVIARLTYVADGHGVPDATVTVVVDDGTPVPMDLVAEEEGDYLATVPAGPGAAIRVTSVEPATAIEAEAPAAAETPTTAGATTTTAGATTADVDVPTTQAPADSVPEPNGIDEAPDEDGGGGDVVVLAVVVVVIVAALAAAFLLRRKRPGEV